MAAGTPRAPHSAHVAAGRELGLGADDLFAGGGLVHRHETDLPVHFPGHVVGTESMERVVGDIEVRVVHSQRIEDRLPEELVQGLAACFLEYGG